ncbi:DUF349 domain-containing protein [Ascidiimonas sp. W6]|uniref:DUF349 domain-containing protein n=1 Tax=Ascidiimonas meishanensis TaxID=3128903 RepID=UPI0030EEE52A
MLDEEKDQLHNHNDLPDKEESTNNSVKTSVNTTSENNDSSEVTDKIVESKTEPAESISPIEGTDNQEDSNNVEVQTSTETNLLEESSSPSTNLTPENKEEEEKKLEDEIDATNAEDAEDESSKERHTIPLLDYHAMSMDTLTEELKKLLKNEKIQAIKTHVDQIKSEFDLKFQELLEQKKEDFLNEGGNEIDFSFHYQPKIVFNDLYKEYRDQRNKYYKDLESKLKTNLANRLDIIEELKGLINVEENINTTYKHFKELQERWRHAGPIPRMEYNNVWRTYHHHIERFYDFLDINRDLRDLDFKHNLEEKQKIILRVQELGSEPDLGKAFRELQELHKIWKEEIGPVDREHREEIWQQFKEATKVIHDKRQEYFKSLEASYQDNLIKKNEIIAKITEIGAQKVTTHGVWQKQIREIESLREEFFNAGKVPLRVNEKIWAEFKEAVRNFNRKKNAFYKGLKKEQHHNYEQKLALVKLAESLKDSDDWTETTPVMKKIQNDWKKIGHVPRKFSDKIWKDFKTACNHYFDRLHSQKNEAYKEELEAFEKKTKFLEDLKNFKLSGEKEKDLEQIQTYIASWKAMGKVPYNKKNIESKFNKILDALFGKINIEKNEAELIKYENKLEQLANSDSDYALNNERVFIRRKIEELKGEIRQLENNLQFFSNASEDNPMVKEVVKKINNHKKDLDLLKAKLKQIKTFK